jgi:hypothetical protein
MTTAHAQLLRKIQARLSSLFDTKQKWSNAHWNWITKFTSVFWPFLRKMKMIEFETTLRSRNISSVYNLCYKVYHKFFSFSFYSSSRQKVPLRRVFQASISVNTEKNLHIQTGGVVNFINFCQILQFSLASFFSRMCDMNVRRCTVLLFERTVKISARQNLI